MWEPGGAPPSGKGVTSEGSLANEGTSLRGMDNNFLFLWVCVCVLQVTLACESIVLYMCEGEVRMDIIHLAKFLSKNMVAYQMNWKSVLSTYFTT